MEAEFTGDILKDKKAEDWYKYERWVKTRVMNAIRNIGYAFFYFVAIIALTFILEWIL
jgi:hypothetical protein